MKSACGTSPSLSPLRMVVGGDALAREESGRVVFVSGALPGERVTVVFRRAKKDFATADVTAVEVASADRVEPCCPAWHRGCGGCDWMHIDPAAQLRLKSDVVREALQRTGRLDDPMVVIGGAVSPWNYRTTVRLAGGTGGRVGFRARRSHDVVPIDRCAVADERINALLATVSVAAGDEVTLRVGDDEAGANAEGRGAVRMHVAGRDLRVSPDSFFQSSTAAAELLVASVTRACADVDMASTVVVDAYGGVGLFAATVASDAAEVIVVESSKSSCADARHNLTGRWATIVQSRFEDWAPVTAGLVIADPARRGLDTGGVSSIVVTQARVVVLVSCDAGALARDARLLTAAGYAHDGTDVLDVFPNTSHIETVTRFVGSSRCS